MNKYLQKIIKYSCGYICSKIMMRELFQAYWMMISKTLATYRYLRDTNSVKASGSIIWMLLPLRNLSEVKNRRYKYVRNCAVNVTTTKTSQIKMIKILNDKITHSVVRYRSCARSPLLITDILLNLKSLTKKRNIYILNNKMRNSYENRRVVFERMHWSQ